MECVWAPGLKYSDGFTKLWPSVFTVAAVFGIAFLGDQLSPLRVMGIALVLAGIAALKLA